MSRKTNCFAFAWRIWRYGRGDSLVVRKSHWGWFPHFMVMFELADGQLVIKEYRPVTPRKRRFPPLFFRGEVVTTCYRKISEHKDATP